MQFMKFSASFYHCESSAESFLTPSLHSISSWQNGQQFGSGNNRQGPSINYHSNVSHQEFCQLNLNAAISGIFDLPVRLTLKRSRHHLTRVSSMFQTKYVLSSNGSGLQLYIEKTTFCGQLGSLQKTTCIQFSVKWTQEGGRQNQTDREKCICGDKFEKSCKKGLFIHP